MPAGHGGSAGVPRCKPCCVHPDALLVSCTAEWMRITVPNLQAPVQAPRLAALLGIGSRDRGCKRRQAAAGRRQRRLCCVAFPAFTQCLPIFARMWPMCQAGTSLLLVPEGSSPQRQRRLIPAAAAGHVLFARYAPVIGAPDPRVAPPRRSPATQALPGHPASRTPASRVPSRSQACTWPIKARAGAGSLNLLSQQSDKAHGAALQPGHRRQRSPQCLRQSARRPELIP